ncbi:putative nicotinate phosphoribosyltransferase [Lachnospiraceae bacterium PM6-15]|uniref:Nicotinate phosphoribosyltransferase n=1 Tax=Ohessyouella blattaphilus TaxID=2949333 RepID=A0ABT1EM07_9FIRM|nr:nicotinate phosphoribosyltransferase [Ohessyouella blattaphilus]MCP1110312.1 nicotinate phosphoribosyltransferase [Ohessyouella blattaphilus]MCR8563706.1 nicotinate phosphoribosyltransferase [Ohessyouella blattaphilus]
MNTRNLTLLTDLYELTMMQGYFEKQQTETVIFDMFYRSNPSKGGYAICAGLEQVIDYVKNLHFDEADVEYLRSLGIFKEPFLAYLRDFKFSGSIYAIPEGTVVFPQEPLVKVIAPILEAQLVETAILNIINHQSLIATKASRIVYAAGSGVMEFGLRRAQGPDAGIFGARAAMIAGCVGTSNVLAGQAFDVPVMGTHAHSWIMTFEDEYTAFKHYASLYPDNCTLLVDTYDTLKSGVPNAIRVFQEFKASDTPLKRFGIRLDSGDLAYLSKEARKMLDSAGLQEAYITASNDLDEYLIHDLKMQQAKIDSWGVGTNLITSEDCPAFGGVYKLAAVSDGGGNFIPKIKISENSAKITNPGDKTVHRIYEKESGKIKADLISFADETFNSEDDLLLFDPIDTWKKTLMKGGTYEVRELLTPIFKDGACIYHSPSVKEIAAYCQQEKDTLWDETKRLFYPHPVFVDLSQKLYDVKQELLNKLG